MIANIKGYGYSAPGVPATGRWKVNLINKGCIRSVPAERHWPVEVGAVGVINGRLHMACWASKISRAAENDCTARVIIRIEFNKTVIVLPYDFTIAVIGADRMNGTVGWSATTTRTAAGAGIAT